MFAHVSQNCRLAVEQSISVTRPNSTTHRAARLLGGLSYHHAGERGRSTAWRNGFGSSLWLAGATHELDITLVIACAAAGAIIGDNIGFWVGRTWGANFLLRYGKFVRLSENRLKLGQYLFVKHGAKIVFFGRFVAFLRVFAALLAGVNKYHWPQFLFFNTAGGIIWALIFGIGAYRFGDLLHRVSGPLEIIALGGFVCGVIAFMYIVRREEKKMEEKLAGRDVDLRTLS